MTNKLYQETINGNRYTVYNDELFWEHFEPEYELNIKLALWHNRYDVTNQSDLARVGDDQYQLVQVRDDGNDELIERIVNHPLLSDDMKQAIRELPEDEYEIGFYLTDWEAVQDALIMLHPEIDYIEPISMTDHSGLWLSRGRRSGWDSGTIGFMYSTSNLTQEEITADYHRYKACFEGDVYLVEVDKPITCECCGHTEYELIDTFGGLLGHIYPDYESMVRELARQI